MNIDHILKARWYLYVAMCLFAVLVVPDVLRLVAGHIKSSPETGPAIEAAQSVQASGQTLYFTNPDGYCDLGDSLNEQAIREEMIHVMAPSVLLHMAAPCAELKGMADENSDSLRNFIQILLFNQARLEMKRSTFLDEMESQMSRLETGEIQQSLQDTIDSKFSNDGIDQKLNAIEFLGRDENVVYISGVTEIEADGRSSTFTSMGAITLIKGLQLGIYVYDVTEDPQSLQNLPSILHDFVDHMLAANPD